MKNGHRLLAVVSLALTLFTQTTLALPAALGGWKAKRPITVTRNVKAAQRGRARGLQRAKCRSDCDKGYNQCVKAKDRPWKNPRQCGIGRDRCYKTCP